ncbi:MAG: hypothetical protein SynsKO_02020 [Synoicihabitans sp.]
MASGFLFFAYGEMASEAAMEKVDELCDLMGVAKVPDHKLSFTKEGFPNFKPEAGASVWGTLWMVPATSMDRLDALATARGLTRGVEFVISPAGPRVPATVYSRADAEDGKPDPILLRDALLAANELKLDRRYRKELEGWREAN